MIKQNYFKFYRDRMIGGFIPTTVAKLKPGQVISFIGAKAVYADIDPVTFNLDPELIEDKITDKTRVIMPVSLYGQCCEWTKLMR